MMSKKEMKLDCVWKLYFDGAYSKEGNNVSLFMIYQKYLPNDLLIGKWEEDDQQ